MVLRASAGMAAVPAMGQGTMNNVSFGDARFTHYETIGGGQGACPDGPGPSAVHVAMSNTLNTPIEVLEREYPLLVERYAVRRRSGGAGTPPGRGRRRPRLPRAGADAVSVMTERRRHGPHGAAGGEAGAAGENRLNGRRAPAKACLELDAGDVLEIRTPGGGGWGPPA